MISLVYVLVTEVVQEVSIRTISAMIVLSYSEDIRVR